MVVSVHLKTGLYQSELFYYFFLDSCMCLQHLTVRVDAANTSVRMCKMCAGPWLNACRLCALVAEVSRRWRALYVHLPPRHEVHGAGEGSSSQSDGQPGELPIEQLAIAPS